MTTFVDAGRTVAVDIEPTALDEIIAFCRASGGLETGGLLIGQYGAFGDRVAVSKITGPPSDSRRTPMSFIRGVAGLARRLATEWRQGLYLVGEWHLHPDASPQPSATDIGQTLTFAKASDYQCPHPVLVVVGGGSGRWRLTIGVVLDERFVPLDVVDEGQSGSAGRNLAEVVSRPQTRRGKGSRQSGKHS
jgi:integrative and conjugative element protein (TIGR02256 family)